jgi:hypothetical protein
LLTYLVLLKPLQDRLTIILDRTKVTKEDFGKRQYRLFHGNSDDYKKAVTYRLLKDCNSNFGLSLFRHYCQALFRKNHDRIMSGVTVEMVLNMQMDHSLSTGEGYGITADDTPLGTHFFRVSRMASQSFQKTLGLFASENEEAQDETTVGVTSPETSMEERIIRGRPKSKSSKGKAKVATVVNNIQTTTIYNNRYTLATHTGKFQSSELPHHEVNPGKLQAILIDAQKMAINGPNLFRTKDVEHCFKTVFSNTADYVVILPTGSGRR